MSTLPSVGGPNLPRKLPRFRPEQVMLQVERFNRASAALNLWADGRDPAHRRGAKHCFDYYEGDQWSEADKAQLDDEGRPHLTLNKIRPLVKLAKGYRLTNQTDIRYLPGLDGGGTAQMAKTMSHLSKNISQRNQLPHVDAEVFADGIVGGRGYWHWFLDFSTNDFGDIKAVAGDPFATYLDPDGDTYNINESNYVMTSRMVSYDEVEHTYGPMAAAMLGPYFNSTSRHAYGMPSSLMEAMAESTPWRTFGGDDGAGNYGLSWDYFSEWVDKARKTIRLLDIQHYIWSERWYFVDLETGDREPVPDWFAEDDDRGRGRIEKILLWSMQQGNPLTLMKRWGRRVRCTHLVGDIIVYDRWSPFDTFTIVPFFAYFRRGKTMGMVEPLMDVQDEINKRRSSLLNILSRTSNGGWIYEKSTLDARMKAAIDLYGSSPGIKIEWDSHGGKLPPPAILGPQVPAMGHAQLEEMFNADMRSIAGVNNSALGEIETVQSGRAIEARQRQTVIGLEDVMANWNRSKQLCGVKQLEIVQDHLTEERLVRVVDSGERPIEVIINQRAAEGIINNVTYGKYQAVVDETPISKTFLEGRFEELMRMVELGLPIPPEFLIRNSSLAEKEEIIMAMQAQMQMQQAQGLAQQMLGGSAAPPPAKSSGGEKKAA